MAEIRVGLSGYSYPEWQGEGLFYPPKLPKSKYLAFYASRYSTVEGVGTFKRMPAESTTENIVKHCPPRFQLSPKMHESVTHYKRLKPEAVESVEYFLKPLLPLRERNMLGPILLQLPPNFAPNLPLLDQFLSAIPQTVRYAVEFRHPGWQTAETEELLRRHKAAWVAEDTDETDALLRNTSDNIYVRLRKTNYTEEQLASWAAKLKSDGRDAHVYVRHLDVESPWRWADRLIELLR